MLLNVLSWPGKTDDWTEDEFYATGESDWEDFRRHWTHYRSDLGGTCVEIGCGPGRITRALAPDFDRVLGLDVSPEMIQRARQATPDNVELHQVEEPAIPMADGEADAVFSVHVLQHLDRFEAVRRYLAETRRVLRPGGSAMLHITLLSTPLRPWRRARIELGIRLSRLGQRRGNKHWLVRMHLYTPERIQRTLRELGFRDVELRVFGVRSNGYVHHFWLATAP